MYPYATILFVLTVLFTLAPVRSMAAQELDHPLFRAIRVRDDRRVEQLLREGTPARLRDRDGTTALMVAALRGTADCMRLLIEQGADANAANVQGFTALHWAAGDFEKVHLLVEAGADVHAKTAERKTALMFAASHIDNDRTIEYLSGLGTDLESRDDEGRSAFHRAVDRASPSAVKRLGDLMRSQGVLGRFSDRDWRDLLSDASVRGDLAILETLYEFLPDKNLVNFVAGPMPIHGALVAQRAEAAHWLLDHGARIDLSVDDHSTVQTLLLSTFFESGDSSLARAMLERGADPTTCNEAGETALTWARRRGNGELVDLLVKAGVPEHPDGPPDVPRRDLEIHAGNRDREIREAAEKSLALMLRSSDVFLEQRSDCVSCHHQYLPAVAASQAREHGLRVDEAALERLTIRHEDWWNQRLPKVHTQDIFLPFLTGNGLGLWSLSALGYPRNLLTDAFVLQYLELQLSDGSWPTRLTRPPMTGGNVQLAALAIRALRAYPVRGRECDIDRAIRRALDWLRDTKANRHDEHVFRLLGLVWAGASEEAWQDDVAALLAAQMSDGGWAQFDGLPADAWATGHALVALATAGAVQPRDPVYRRGVDFLLRTQFDDGSWFVQRRAVPFQVPFESGFPFGKDQWISISGTAWAVMALVRAIEPDSTAVVPTRSTTFLKAPQRAEATSYDGGDTPEASGGADEPRAEEEEGSEGTPETPAPPTTLARAISFENDVAPILSRSCLKCHSGSLPEGELDITRRNRFLKGGKSGRPAIVPGKSAESRLLRVITATRKSLQMPPPKARDEFPALGENEIAIMHTWIEQGAKMPE